MSREPNLNQNVVGMKTQPSAGIADGLYQHLDVSSTLRPCAEYNGPEIERMVSKRLL